MYCTFWWNETNYRIWKKKKKKTPVALLDKTISNTNIITWKIGMYTKSLIRSYIYKAHAWYIGPIGSQIILWERFFSVPKTRSGTPSIIIQVVGYLKNKIHQLYYDIWFLVHWNLYRLMVVKNGLIAFNLL